MIAKNAKFLGWQNGWKEEPYEVIASEKAGHKIETTSTQRGVTTVKCPEGGWYYKVDSGD